MPFGFAIAASFLCMLFEPLEELPFNGNEVSIEDQIKDAYERGGERVDKELCALVYDIYTLSKKWNVELE